MPLIGGADKIGQFDFSVFQNYFTILAQASLHPFTPTQAMSFVSCYAWKNEWGHS